MRGRKANILSFSDELWIGLHTPTRPGDTRSGYVWYSSQHRPTLDNGFEQLHWEDCAYMKKDGRWEDANCEDVKPIICEKE
jgi:hypothetical protein